MMDILATPLIRAAFAPFGDVLETTEIPDKIINDGRCKRFHDQANIDCADHKIGMSIFDSEVCALPYRLDLMERHPLGSQAFIPMNAGVFLVIVAEDSGGVPAKPQAFYTAPFQGINFHRNIWHGPLAPLSPKAIYMVVDYVGTEPNLEEYTFETPYRIITSDPAKKTLARPEAKY